MNYLGSKVRLSGFIYQEIKKSVKEQLTNLSFCDLFSGTGTVGNLFHTKVKSVLYNDREYYSYIINKAFHSSISEHAYISMLHNLNELEEVEGFIFEEYSQSGSSGRLYFNAVNGKKIDAIRIYIEQLFLSSKIDKEFYFLLLATLLVAADKVANTASVYCAYLKKLKKTALNDLKMLPILRAIEPFNHKVYKAESNDLIKRIDGDILYLDPPYIGREYSSYYHLLNTIAIYDTELKPQGKTGLRPYNTSSFCLKRSAEDSLFELLRNAQFKYIFLSYNNEGFIKPSRIAEMMSSLGEHACSSVKYPKFKSCKTNSKQYTEEYLHCLIKD
ncbi:DNA adenine methylase [Epilithonimonas zeae]|uniref:site-specific DNA-methyltransferase (adenine-specific) n=1 Tax=Epilithonimonas zeae TaxID=1416779 RepID=A0A1N6FR37_9FLAO|nr:DNA adenine methylase [Epilithonimonas zeae]SIN97759.1 adenine-specific DNA-methyltransferase [Epilithonimonas zeae]